MQIKQVYFSPGVKFFEKGFYDKWNVVKYHSRHEPALFIGMYRDIDVKMINRHKGFKALWNTGRIREQITRVNPKNVVIRISPESIVDDNTRQYEKYYLTNFKYKHCNFPIKDFSKFIPTKIGNKIYCYLGNEKAKYIMGFEMAEKIKDKTGFEMICSMQGHTMDWIMGNYYNDCFVNLKATIIPGYTTSTELAYMGRYTISNSNGPFFKPYKTIDDILRLIDKESEKIGTIQKPLVADFFDTGEEWKNVNFWI